MPLLTMQHTATHCNTLQHTATQTSYPYKGVDGTCKFSKTAVGSSISGYKDVPADSEGDTRIESCHTYGRVMSHT